MLTVNFIRVYYLFGIQKSEVAINYTLFICISMAAEFYLIFFLALTSFAQRLYSFSFQIFLPFVCAIHFLSVHEKKILTLGRKMMAYTQVYVYTV